MIASASSSSLREQGGNGDSQNKKRRKRYALSCSACKDRKIKCDRNVPNCSSCVARGIQRNCRWGDERDDDIVHKVSTKQSPGGSNGTEVDDVVERVLKRLKSKESIQEISPSADFSVEPPITGGKLPIMAMKTAHLVETSAFDGVKVPLGGEGRLNLRCMFQTHTIQSDVIRSSLFALPSRDSVDILVEHYIAECEPARSIFNTAILFRQLDDFWRGVDELGARNDDPVWPTIFDQPVLNVMPRPSENVIGPNYVKGKTPYLCSILRQGLISVVFGLMATSLNTLTNDTIRRMGVFSTEMTEENMNKWKRQYENLSLMHLNLADYIDQPTIWALQALRLHLVLSLDLKRINTSAVHNSVAVRLSICLGLNRLGSAVEDVQRMREKESKGAEAIVAAEKESEMHKLNNAASAPQGVYIANFEEGNLALRELGRKIWIQILATDWLFGSHIDSVYLVNDYINQSDPPCSLQDAELLSEAAPSLLCRKELNDIVSENAFPRCFLAIAQAGRLQIQLENVHGSPLDYQHVLRVDAGFQTALQSFPWFLSFTQLQAEQRQRSKLLPTFSKQINLQRIIIHDQVQFRLLRLHRLYLGKGFKDTKYRYSLDACLNSANVIIDAKVELSRLKTKSKTIVPLQIHLLQAALVLHLVLIYELEQQQDQSKAKFNSIQQRRAKGHFVLEDFDGTLKQLQLAMVFLREDSASLLWLSKGLNILEAFVRMLKDRNVAKSPSPSHSAAADILASIPSSTISFATPSSNTSTAATFQDPSLMGASSSAAPSTSSAVDNAQFEFASSVGPAAATSTFWNHDANLDPYYNPEMWSLDALFPNNDTYPIDLVDALEKIVWAQ